jgi:hypothetical protein
MKKFALLTLFAYLSIAFAPLGMAFDFRNVRWNEDGNKCVQNFDNKLELIITREDVDEIEIGDPEEGDIVSEELPDEPTEPDEPADPDEPTEEAEPDDSTYGQLDPNGLTEEVENQLDLFESNLAAIRKDAADHNENICGQINPITDYLEKGDCTASGAVVTEISEIIGPAIADDGEGNQIIDVYKGTCCLIINTKDGAYQSCKEKRSIYALEKPECEKHSPFCEKRQWIISKSGVGIIKIYVKQLYIWAAGTIGLISVVTLVISGIQISVSGVSGDITAAKDRIMKVFVGLILLFFSGIILYTINPTFFS